MEDLYTNEELHMVGNYGSIETDLDERLSKYIVYDIFAELKFNYPIDNYEYMYWDTIKESSYYKRADSSIDTSGVTNEIRPDSGAIIIRNKNNYNDWHLILAAEDKNQENVGNAIERFAKNYNAMNDKVCHGCEILPYVLFCSGRGLCLKNETLREHIESKFRQALPFLKDGNPYIWSVQQEYTIYKNGWNLVYTRKNRFKYGDKKEILMGVAIDAIEYYKTKLKS